MKTIYIIGLIILTIGLITGGFFLFNNPKDAVAGLGAEPIDVFGTKTGTTTVGTSLTLLASMGTTSKAVYLGFDIDTAAFTMKPVTSSTTGSYYEWNILASNDTGCETATTSTIWNMYKVSDINWFTPTSANSSNLSGRTTFAAGATATGTIAHLKDLTYRCLKLELLGTSTTMWVQFVKKQN